MTKQPAKKSVSVTGNLKRAFCETEQKFVGDWHENEDAVYDDIDAHRAKPGCQHHNVRVVDK
jgi:hypothetical protein